MAISSRTSLTSIRISKLYELFFELESDVSSTLSAASAQVKNELIELWEFAGYGNILKDQSDINKKIKALRTSHYNLTKVPLVRRQKHFFKMKEVAFLNSLEKLLDITVKSLQSSQPITDEDRDFLQNHWMKTISSTPDRNLQKNLEKKLARQKSLERYSLAKSSTSPTFLSASMSSDDSQLGISLQEEEYTPKRPCGSRGTTIEISKRFVQKLGSAADRLNQSSTQLTGILAAATNHGGGDIGMIALSKSTTNRLRTAFRKEEAKLIRNDFTCDIEDLKWQRKSTFFRFLQKQWR